MKLTLAASLTLTLFMLFSPLQAAQAAPENFALIQSGTFTMGSPETESWRSKDEVQHQVTLNSFYMSKYEVTQKEYEALMKVNPSTFKGSNLPVNNVSWFDALAYCNARSTAEGLTPAYSIEGTAVRWDRGANGYRLPTEAEWEYACRAGTNTPFNTQTSISAEEANYYGHYPYEIEGNYFNQSALATKPGIYREETTPVGSFAPNKWGLYDMHGNVWEWCWDYYGDYESGAQTDPAGPVSGALRVSRGGGWNDFAKNLRSSYRSSTPPEQSSYNTGFRLVLNASAAVGHILSATENMERSTAKTPKILIAYFSWGGTTRGIAQQIQQISGADIFEIRCAAPYSANYHTVLREAQRDQRAQARPKLAAHVKNMAQYDVVILGYPNWWASIPMPVATFLEEYDFSKKTIFPFCSHGGGRFGQSLTAIAKLVPQAKLARGLSVFYSGGGSLPAEIRSWLKENGIETK